MNRISGDNLPYAELCLYYGAEKFLERAEKICHDCAAWDILQRLHRLKIKYALRIDFGQYFNFSEEDAHKYLSRRLIQAGELLDETINFCDRHSTEPNYSAENYLEIAALTDDAINAEITFIADEEFAAELNLLYGKIFLLIESAAENLSAATFPNEKKIRSLKKIRDFYDANDYTAMYRSENFSDPERQYFYQTEIDKLKSDAIINVGVSLCDSAFDYEFKGDFDKAIELYERAYTSGDEPYDYVLPALARVCKEVGYIERAIETLKRVLEIDRERNRNYTCHACNDLINIFFEEGRFDEARKFSEELIHYSAGSADSYKVTYSIVGHHDLYRLEAEPQSKKFFWEKCLEQFKLLDDEKNLSDALNDFLKTYAEKLPDTEESLAILDSLISRADKSRAIFERAIKLSKDLCRAEYHIKFLTEYALSLKDEPEALSYCLEAENFLAANNLHDEYLESLIYYTQAECMSREDFSYEQIDSVKKKCNYILLTEKNIEHLTDAERCEAWEDAADFYNGFDAHGGRLYCLQKALELLDTTDFEKVWRLKCAIIDCRKSLGDSDEVRRAVLLLYKILLTEDAADFADKIKILATYLEKTDADEEFFALNFFAIYVALADDADKELISAPTLNEKFFEVFKLTLETDSAANQIDFVNDICDAIKSSAKNFSAAEKYLRLLEEFIRRHQFGDFDFKNGD